MTYIDKGTGCAVLSSHGLFGGYDQAYELVKNFSQRYRILAPSRFGYLGSDISGKGEPAEQAKSFKELLDTLGVDKAFIIGASAGGTAAIRFALDYPERTYGLILYSSAPPLKEKPAAYSEYIGVPPFIVNDYAMYLLSPLFRLVLSMPANVIDLMMPIDKRKQGVILDGSLSNPDMARHFDDYPIERLQVPSLILHAKNDKTVDYRKTADVIFRFPNCTLISFETGGHMLAGHEKEVEKAIDTFIKNTLNITAAAVE
ncbi:alpha/beta fold hydrolase [Treponema maltophilum]|uniref:alpha/beta fold hydrolase n=1 Tax=Treponema maltophilum TaxID=51160 RepID=UPI003D90E741